MIDHTTLVLYYDMIWNYAILCYTAIDNTTLYDTKL